MKKLLSTLVLFSVLISPLIVALETLAQISPPITPPGVPAKAPVINPLEALKRIVDFVFFILLIFAALMIVIAGFLFITAMGDTEKVNTARNFVLWAMVGVLVAFLARGLVWFVGNLMGHQVTW